MTLLQAQVALSGLKLQAKTGMKLTNKVNIYRMVANALGYPSNSRPSIPTLIEQLEQAINDTRAEAGLPPRN
jgi:hypothetical protein